MAACSNDSASHTVLTRGRPQLMATWHGHAPITSEVLLSILERAVAGANDLSRAERILYTACEFWAATAARTIVTHLGSEPADNLRDAVTAFSAIGAVRVASTLNTVVSDLSHDSTQQQARQRLSVLEDNLSNTTEPVDELIACFAQHLKESSGIRLRGRL